MASNQNLGDGFGSVSSLNTNSLDGSTTSDGSDLFRDENVNAIDVYINTDEKLSLLRLLNSNFASKSKIATKTMKKILWVRILTDDQNLRTRMIQWLKERSYIKPEAKKPDLGNIHILLKNANHIESADVLRKKLATINIAPIDIQWHLTGYMREKNIKPVWWRLTFEPNTNVNDVLKTRKIEGATVRFDYMKIKCERCNEMHQHDQCKKDVKRT